MECSSAFDTFFIDIEDLWALIGFLETEIRENKYLKKKEMYNI